MKQGSGLDRRRSNYVLAITTTWPPMAAGSGRAFQELISGVDNLVALVPKSPIPWPDPPWVRRVLRFSGRSGGVLKINSVLQHCEILMMPLLWRLSFGMGRPALLLFNLPLFAGVGALILQTISGVPYIVEALGEEFTTALLSRSLFRWRYRLTRLILHRALAVVCIAANTRAILSEHYGLPLQALRVMNPTLDPSEASLISSDEASAARKRLVGAGRMVLMVGRLSQTRKGFDKAIEALPLILADVPAAHLVIAGPGDSGILRNLTKSLGVEARVVFTGEVDRKELLTLYAACDVFLLPTRTMPDGDIEGFGMVFLEANMFGKPVVGGRTGGTGEAILDGVTGLLIDGDDIQGISNAVKRLLKDRALAHRLGQEGQQRVFREFNSAVQQKEFAKVIGQILATHQ